MDSDTPKNILSSESKLLDELKLKEGFSSDAKLAAALGVTRGFICSVRKGRKRLSLDLAKEIFSRLGRVFSTQDLEALLLPIKIRMHRFKLSAIRRDVIDRSNGCCQLCGNLAPFKTPDGRPYLEIHYLTLPRDGGSDSPENLVALCPNCNRKIELAPTSIDLDKLRKLSQAKLRKDK